MKKITEGIALLKPFSLYEISGTVLTESTHSETQTTGSVGTSDNLAHSLAPHMPRAIKGKIKSTTTRYQTIHLKDSDERRHVVELVDFIVPCAEGDVLSFWGIQEDRWFAARNHSTGKKYKKLSKARSDLYPVRMHLVATVLLAVPLWLDMKAQNDDAGFSVFAGLICLVLAGLITWVPMAILAFIRSMIVIRKVPFDAPQ